MKKADLFVELLKDIVDFVDNYKFRRDKINFPKNKEGVYMYAYKERVVCISKGGLALFKSKNYLEISILSRTALESLFYFLSLKNDKAFLKSFRGDHDIQKKKMFNELSCNPEVMTDLKFSKEDVDDCLLKIRQNIDKADIKDEINVQKSAKIAGLASMYTSAFRLLSQVSHSKVKILENHFTYNDKFIFTNIQDKNNAIMPLDVLALVLLIMSFNLVDYASIGDKRIKDRLETFTLRYKKISASHNL